MIEATATIANAVADPLALLGATVAALPLSPQRIVARVSAVAAAQGG